MARMTLGRVVFVLSCALMPAAIAGGGDDGTHSGTVVLDFDLVRNVILLEARINGAGPFSLLVDTGVTPSVIDLAAAERSGCPVDRKTSGEADGAGDGRGLQLFPATICDLTLGDLSVGDVAAVAANLSGLGEKLGRPLHGILGHSFLEGRVIRVDYPGRVFQIEPPPRALRPGAVQLPLRYVAGDIIPLIQDLRVNGQPVAVSLDTGSSLTLELYPATTERLGLGETAAGGTEQSVTGARGDARVRQNTVGRIDLGTLSMNEPEVTFSQRQDHGKRDGNLGGGFLREFVMTLDYRSMRIVLEPSAK